MRFALPTAVHPDQVFELRLENGLSLYVTSVLEPDHDRCRLLLKERMPAPMLTISHSLALNMLRSDPSYCYRLTRFPQSKVEAVARKFRAEAAIILDCDQAGARLYLGSWLTVSFKQHSELVYSARTSPQWKLPSPLASVGLAQKLPSYIEG